MYTLNTTALGVKVGLNKRWAPINLNEIQVNELIALYRIVQIELTLVGDTQPLYLRVSDIAEEYNSFAGLFQTLLDSLTAALPTSTTPIIPSRDVARYYDVFKLRYKVRVVDENNIEYTTPDNNLPQDHLRIDREDTLIDIPSALSQVLVNVNGFYHQVENVGNKGLFIRDGNKSLQISQQNAIGMWDFQELGGFTVVPTIPILPIVEGFPVLVQFTQPVADKTVFFVIAGYFFPVDGQSVRQIGPTLFVIDFLHPNMRLAARYFEASEYIDLSTIQATAAGITPGTIEVPQLYSPQALAAWLNLSQSFAVIVNRKDTYLAQRYVKRTNNPNQYLCYLDRDPTDLPNETNNARLRLEPPCFPMVMELGRQPPYWTTTEGWVHSLTIHSNRVAQLLYETVQPVEQIVTSGADQPGSPGLVQHAYLLEFGSMVKDQVI